MKKEVKKMDYKEFKAEFNRKIWHVQELAFNK